MTMNPQWAAVGESIRQLMAASVSCSVTELWGFLLRLHLRANWGRIVLIISNLNQNVNR